MPASDSARATTPSRSSAPLNSRRASTLGVFALLLAFRVANALALRTFFQPDEFFQSLEPAWQLAFGQHSNACITWEWRRQLRSSLHPRIFAALYRMAAQLAEGCGLSVAVRAQVLVAAPKVAQAVSAALLDGCTWRLAEKAYGRGSRTAFTTLALSVCSPWQWFCSVRTLSNCLETTATSIAVYLWPWHGLGRHARDGAGDAEEGGRASSLVRFRLSLLLAAFACILRPTNALVWLAVSLPAFWQASNRMRVVLVREILCCGSAVFACSLLSDRLYYRVWTFPPLRFLYFNIAQSLAVFYGKNRPDYYLTEGLPLLLTTALPFAVVGTWQSLYRQPAQAASSSKQSAAEVDAVQRSILTRLAWTSLIVTLSLSLISHKEVRFLYPILPFLHVLCARPLTLFFTPPSSISRKVILTAILTANVLIAGYASQVHQRGVIDVLSYIRHKHEARNGLSLSNALVNEQHQHDNTATSPTTVGFLMPCHSTPWRSHLVYPEIDAWALTCEPPLDIPFSLRSAYLDEADEFYIQPGPTAWLRSNMEDTETITASGSRSGRHWAKQDPRFKRKYKREWPQNLVFFEQLEPILREHLAGTRYKECWRGFNTHFHDDARRKGDVIVWCLDE